MDRTRTAQARQIIRRRSDVSIIEIVPTALTQPVQLSDQVGIVLISQRRHEAVAVAAGILTMAVGALPAEDASAQHELCTIPGLRTTGQGHPVQIRRDVDPALRSPQILLRYNAVHGLAVAFLTGKIG